MSTTHKLPRRDKCFAFGARGLKLTKEQAASAWWFLCAEMQIMGDLDMPKFKHLLHAIRVATIQSKKD